MGDLSELRELISKTWWGQFTSRGLLLLHAGGVSDGERAIILPGVSGAGKTTTVRLMMERGFHALGDELMVVYLSNGKLYVSPAEEFVSGTYNKIDPEIRRAELLSTILLAPDGDGKIVRYNLKKDGLFFNFPRNSIPGVSSWRIMSDIISELLRRPVYIARRPPLARLAEFIEDLFFSTNNR